MSGISQNQQPLTVAAGEVLLSARFKSQQQQQQPRLVSSTSNLKNYTFTEFKFDNFTFLYPNNCQRILISILI
jgi:hypothetical protein